MSTVLDEVLKANAQYAGDFGPKGQLSHRPKRRIAILTCMDARLDPAKFAGLREGDAHVIRNAGGRASDDAIRSLVISYALLGTREWFVIHHTECGMQTFTNESMADLLARSPEIAVPPPSGWKDASRWPGPVEGRYINWLAFTDGARAITEDVIRIRRHPLVPRDIPIYGLIYDVKTGKLAEVPEAMQAGRPA